MRDDMSKLLVLRGSTSGRWVRDRPPQKHKDLESLPKREAIGRTYRDKSPGEYFAPFRRLILARCGQPWNKVYSEVRAALRVTSAVHLHILQHLDHMVIVHPVLIDGVVFSNYLRKGKREPVSRSRFCCAYVDERGILRALPNIPRKKRKKPARMEPSHLHR